MSHQPRTLVLLVSFAAALAACSGEDDGGDMQTLTLTPGLFSGPYDISGTVAVNAPLPSGTRVSLMLSEASGSLAFKKLTSANAFENHTLGGTRSSLGFAVKGIKAGKYVVAIAADTSKDGAIGAGDVGGFYGGTAEKPAIFGKDAQVLTVTSVSLTALSFGIGPVTCKASVGQTCAVDDDCRGTVCTGSGGIKTGLTNGACDVASKTCKLVSCASFAGATASEGSCFGGL